MSWWKRPLIALAAMIMWFFGLLAVGALGYPSEYFWASECAGAIGFAAAPFWRFRASRWFWPSVVVLIIVHLVGMYLLRVQVSVRNLLSKAAFQGLLLADCMACWLVIVGIAYQAEGRFPWKDGKQS